MSCLQPFLCGARMRHGRIGFCTKRDSALSVDGFAIYTSYSFPSRTRRDSSLRRRYLGATPWENWSPPPSTVGHMGRRHTQSRGDITMAATTKSRTPLLIVFIDLTRFFAQAQRVDDAELAETVDGY